MSAPKVFIDGQEGTTGLQIQQRLAGRDDIRLLQIDPDKRKDTAERKRLMHEADLVFLCLPDAAAEEAAGLIEEAGTRVIDASTAHRTTPGWVYGFPELTGQREKIAAADRVANPGCYATGAIALLRPLIEAGLMAPDYPVMIHALSGYTGGGKKTIAEYEGLDRDGELDSPRHYAVTLKHKHIPEIMALSGLTRRPIFNPIICDFPQGMVVAAPLFLDMLQRAPNLEQIRAIYTNYYSGSPIISVKPPEAPVCGFIGSNNLAGTDQMEIFVCGNEEQAFVLSRLDNLGKGASGAAVQNMNLMLGFEMTRGLT